MTAFHVVLAGGGTAGHLFPGLAVADQLTQLKPTQISVLGTGKELERRLVAQAGYDYRVIASGPMPRRPQDALRAVADNLRGYYQAKRYLREQAPQVVIGLGGYASVPTVRAASALGIPIILLEQNAVLGKATRWLSRYAKIVCLAMPDARGQLAYPARGHVVGCPVRRDFVEAEYQPLPRKQRLVVLGGSGGASPLNQQVPLALYRLREQLTGWQIIHQTGPRDQLATEGIYRKLGFKAQVGAFIHNMARTLAAADLVISRAGGSTLAELACCGTPALLVPYPHATDQHQLRNAEVVSGAGGALVIDEQAVTGRLDHALADRLAPVLKSQRLRERMSQGMLSLAQPAAAADISRVVLGAAVPSAVAC